MMTDYKSPETSQAPVLKYLLNHSLSLNIVSFFLLSFVAFRTNSSYLYYGSDGRFEITLLTQNIRFVPLIFGYTNNFIQGLGNVWFTFNPRFLPSYFLSLAEDGAFTNFALSYAISAGELFIATYLAARIACLSRLAALCAAWLLPLLTYRYVEWGKIPSTFASFPHYATIAGLSAVMSASLLHLDHRRFYISIAILGLFFVGITYIVVVAPTLIILVIPELGFFGLVSVVASKTKSELIFKLISFAAICTLCFLLGYVDFVTGLVIYTAADLFKGLSTRPTSLQEVSMLFWSATPPLLTIERSFVGFGLLGGMWVAWRSPGLLRLAAFAFLSTAATILAAGLLHVTYRFWYGPAFWYFEGFLFPYHAIFATVLVFEIIRLILTPLLKLWRPNRLGTANVRCAAGALATLVIAIVPWIYIRGQQNVVPPSNPTFYVPYPQLETPITKILKDEISVNPGGIFRGRVATLTGRMFPASTNVDIVGLWGIPRYLATYATGNSHDMAGLWQDSIPTLIEYNPLMTPPYFAFARSFFTEPVDLQIRNLPAMRHIDSRLLAAIGVRFVITDRPVEGGAILRQTLEVPVSDKFVEGSGINGLLKRAGLSPKLSSFTLYLYELNGVNFGQYSPSKSLAVHTASEMLAALGDSGIDLSRTFVAAEDFPEDLSAARLHEFRIEPGEFTIKATSLGRSVLILPVEFSRCLQLFVRGQTVSSTRLFRADLLITGIVFQGSLDATISYRTGPLSNSRCRLLDRQDMEAIDMKNAFKDRPELIPRSMEF